MSTINRSITNTPVRHPASPAAAAALSSSTAQRAATALDKGLAISWHLPLAQLHLAGRQVQAATWNVRTGDVVNEATATLTLTDADGRTIPLPAHLATALVGSADVLIAGDLLHIDMCGPTKLLALTLRLTAEGSELFFASAAALDLLGMTGGRAEWPVLTT